MISIFPNILTTDKPYFIEIDKALERIKSGKSKDLVDKIRLEGDAKKRNEYKKQLPCVCFSGTFKTRKASDLIKYSHFIVLDIDKIEAPAEYRDLVSQNEYTYAAWISPSGNGVKILIKVSTENHLGHFLALSKTFENVDQSGKDICRVTYESFDSGIYINTQSTEFTDFIENLHTAPLNGSNKKAVSTDYARANIALEMIRGALAREKHIILLKASKLMGGFIAGGLIEEHEGIRLLENEIELKGVDSMSDARTCIKKGIEYGKANPIEATTYSNYQYTSKVKPSIEVNDFDFLADKAEVDECLSMWRNNTFEVGRTTGFPSLDKYFLFKRGNFNVFNGFDNVGKALAIDTPIPTPTGWVTMGELKIGDDIFGDDGKVCEVVFATDVMLNKKTYKILFSNSDEIVCCEDHLWNVRWIGGTIIKTMSVKEMINKGVKTIQKYKTLNNYSINLPKPLKMPSRSNFIINPYTLGVWLGDGLSNSNRVSTSIGDMDEMVLHIIADGYDAVPSKYKEACLVKIKTGNFIIRLRCLNLFKNKHIPSEYLRASIEERIELLQGLMDTDGYVDKNGRLEFCNKNPKIAEPFMELLSSLGIKFCCSRKTPSINGIKMNYKAYYISFSCSLNMFPVFKLKRKIARMSNLRTRGRTVQITDIIEIDSVPVRCIQVDNKSNLFLCGKTMIPTHNTTILAYFALLSAMLYGWKWILLSTENKNGTVIKRLIEFYFGESIATMNELKYKAAKEFINKHFAIIKNDKMYNFKDVLLMADKLMEKQKYDGILIDPYNSLKIDLSDNSKLNTHEYHYEAASEMQQFAKQRDICVYLNCHVVTKAMRERVAPFKADTEGGGKFANKADDFITIHREVQSPDLWNQTQLHIRKIKEIETGGGYTPLETPYILTMTYGGFGFVDQFGYNPVLNFHTPQESNEIAFDIHTLNDLEAKEQDINSNSESKHTYAIPLGTDVLPF